jgi:hypothetical protein
MFDTDLTRDYEAAQRLGLDPHAAFDAGVAGALADDEVKASLRAVGDAHEWAVP